MLRGQLSRAAAAPKLGIRYPPPPDRVKEKQGDVGCTYTLLSKPHIPVESRARDEAEPPAEGRGPSWTTLATRATVLAQTWPIKPPDTVAKHLPRWTWSKVNPIT